MDEPRPDAGAGWSKAIHDLPTHQAHGPITMYKRDGLRVTTTKSPGGLPIIGISAELGEDELEPPTAEQVRLVLRTFGGGPHWLPLAETPTALYLGVRPPDWAVKGGVRETRH